MVAEFITGGGCAGAELPRSLLREGALMRDSLLADLALLPEFEVTVLHDPRTPLPEPVAQRVPVTTAGTFEATFAAELARHDLTLIIAPESDGALFRLTRAAETAGRPLLSSASDAVAIAGSKSATAAALAAAGVAVVPTAFEAARLAEGASGYVVKPDDGAGCEHQVYCARRADVDTALAGATAVGRFVVQPYLDGPALSLTLLCQNGAALLLASNRQIVRRIGRGFRLEGVEVNGWQGDPDGLAALANAVAQALPGLHGLVGIDLVATERESIVLEVNPRLTTAYAGLHASIGRNPLALVAAAHAGASLAELGAGLARCPVTVLIPEAVDA